MLWTLIKELLPVKTLIIYGVIAAAVLGAGTWYTVSIFQRGRASAFNEIAHENKEALDVVNALKAKRRACPDDMWDQSHGVCQQ